MASSPVIAQIRVWEVTGPWLRESHLLTRDLRIENGHVLIPEGPGMGVEVDHDALERYCTHHGAWPAG